MSFPQTTSVTDVIKGIREGRRWAFPRLSLFPRAIDAYLERGETGPLDFYDTLTARERELLQMIVESLSGSEVGRRLFISPRTVEIHRQNAMRKLGLRNQVELIRYALKKAFYQTTPAHLHCWGSKIT
jgi:two-component system, NarL family, response regulator NreC